MGIKRNVTVRGRGMCTRQFELTRPTEGTRKHEHEMKKRQKVNYV